MKRTRLYIYILSMVAVLIFVLMMSVPKEEIAPKKECINQGSCPDEPKHNDDLFMNPLNKFIVMM